MRTIRHVNAIVERNRPDFRPVPLYINASGNSFGKSPETWNPFEDISAAMEVIKVTRLKGYNLLLEAKSGYEWFCVFEMRSDLAQQSGMFRTGYATAPEAERAICEAALATEGKDREHQARRANSKVEHGNLSGELCDLLLDSVVSTG